MICRFCLNLLRLFRGTRQKVNTTKYFATRFLSWFEDKRGPLPFSVFAAAGNQKLPFYAFSSLPGFDCPGAALVFTGTMNTRRKTSARAGVTLSRGWRYPAAFFRQLQNSVLLRSNAGREIVANQFNEIPRGGPCAYMLTGICSLEILRFWMDLCKSRTDITIAGHNGLAGYGYSKSWKLFIELDRSGYVWPANYLLNVSSGSRYGDEEKARYCNWIALAANLSRSRLHANILQIRPTKTKETPGQKNTEKRLPII